jgi:hypothetical protein
VYGSRSRYGVLVTVSYRIKSATGMRIPFLKLASEQQKPNHFQIPERIYPLVKLHKTREIPDSPSSLSKRSQTAHPPRDLSDKPLPSLPPSTIISWHCFSPIHLQPSPPALFERSKLSQHPAPSHMFIHGLVCATGLLPGARPYGAPPVAP